MSLPTGTWQVDPTATTITVTVKKIFGLVTVPATLSVTSGSIEIDGDHRVSGVEVVADAGSYDSGDAKRDQWALQASVIDPESHPEFVFSAGQLTPVGAGHRAVGSVTVKGRSHPLSVEVTDVDVADGRGTFTATGELDRKAIGVGKLPSFVISRTVQLEVRASCTLES